METGVETPQIILNREASQLQYSAILGGSAGFTTSLPAGGSANKIAFSTWVKPDSINTKKALWVDGTSGIYINSSGLQLSWSGYDITLANIANLEINQWSHIYVAIDTTQVDSVKRIQVFVDGIAIEISKFPIFNSSLGDINKSGISRKVGISGTATETYKGALSETHIIDGQDVKVQDFGYFDKSGIWKASTYNGSHGATGSYLDYSASNNLGLNAGFDGISLTSPSSSITRGDGIVLNRGISDIDGGYVNKDETGSM